MMKRDKLVACIDVSESAELAVRTLMPGSNRKATPRKTRTTSFNNFTRSFDLSSSDESKPT
jgi:hypothetical protein